MIGKYAGGIGISITNLRADGQEIRGTAGRSDGIVPALHNFQATARHINQGGRRKGSFAIYLEPWHADIERFIQLRRNDGIESLRCRDLFYGLWVNDLFMQRVRADDAWSLFCPSKTPELIDLYGTNFAEAYCRAEDQKMYVRQLPARELWSLLLDTQAQTGMPYMCFKDAANQKSNHRHLGTLRGSNLCTEIMQFHGWSPVTGDYEVAVCNLASVALPRFVLGGDLDWENLRRTAYQLCINLNRIIDLNFYPTEACKRSIYATDPSVSE